MSYLLIRLIKLWQKVIYPILRPIFPSSCRFTPTCSTYTIQSIEKYGVLKGGFLSFKRILRCNPFSATRF